MDDKPWNKRYIVIIGGGVVVAIAPPPALTTRWTDVFVLEALPKIGMGASSRNGGVILLGLYYSPGSLKSPSLSPRQSIQLGRSVSPTKSRIAAPASWSSRHRRRSSRTRCTDEDW